MCHIHGGPMEVASLSALPGGAGGAVGRLTVNVDDGVLGQRLRVVELTLSHSVTVGPNVEIRRKDAAWQRDDDRLVLDAVTKGVRRCQDKMVRQAKKNTDSAT